MSALNLLSVNGTGNYVEGVVNGRASGGLVRSSSCKIPLSNLRIASWNVGTLRGRSNEIVDTLYRRNVDICCVQEVRWRGAGTRIVSNGKGSQNKFF